MCALLSGAGVLVCKHLWDARRQVLRRADVEELVRTVRVAVRTEHTRDQKLRLWISHAEHAHERNRAAFAERHGPFSEVSLRRALNRFLQPRRDGGRFPTRAALLRF